MPTSRAPFVDVVAAVREHTSLLLGLTIGFTDDDWAQPTALPGWTRSHVAAHLVDGARRLIAVIDSLGAARPVALHVDDDEERRSVEVLALASGLDLQISLDTSASELQEMLPALEGDTTPVVTRSGYTIPAWQIPLARLGEVVLHHMDLDGRAGVVDLAPDTAVALLAFQVERYAERPNRRSVRLVADEGYTADVDGVDDQVEVRGPATDLILWLARGVSSPKLIRSWF